MRGRPATACHAVGFRRTARPSAVDLRLVRVLRVVWTVMVSCWHIWTDVGERPHARHQFPRRDPAARQARSEAARCRQPAIIGPARVRLCRYQLPERCRSRKRHHLKRVSRFMRICARRKRYRLTICIPVQERDDCQQSGRGALDIHRQCDDRIGGGNADGGQRYELHGAIIRT